MFHHTWPFLYFVFLCYGDYVLIVLVIFFCSAFPRQSAEDKVLFEEKRNLSLELDVGYRRCVNLFTEELLRKHVFLRGSTLFSRTMI